MLLWTFNTLEALRLSCYTCKRLDYFVVGILDQNSMLSQFFCHIGLNTLCSMQVWKPVTSDKMCSIICEMLNFTTKFSIFIYYKTSEPELI